MRRKIILLLGLLSVLFVGCRNKNQIQMTRQPPEETIALSRANTELIKYDVNLSDFVDKDMMPVLSIEHYQNGEHIETLDSIDYGDIIKEKKKLIASIGLTESKNDFAIFSITFNNIGHGSGVQFSEKIITKDFILLDKEFSKIEKDVEYPLAVYWAGNYSESHYPVNLSDLESKIEAYEDVYVFTFKVTDYKTNPL